MTDGIKKMRARADQREYDTAYEAAMNKGIADYALSVERLSSFVETLKFHIPHPHQATVLKELTLLMEAVGELIPAPIRETYEARMASKRVEITGGVM